MIRCVIAFAVALVFCLPKPSVGAEPQLAHMVYFKLKERNYKAKERLVIACKKHLSGHDGTVYFSVGVLASDLKREVNDVDFDVALNLVFRNKAAHDKYQTHPRHLRFIEENKDSWAEVRVFDSYLVAPARDRTLPKRIPLPDLAASFAGMIRGTVVETRDGQFVVKVSEVAKEWEHSKAEDADDMIGELVLVDATKRDVFRRFASKLERGEQVTLDVAHKAGEALRLLELTEDQRARVKR